MMMWFWDRGYHGRINQVREPFVIGDRKGALFVATRFYMAYGFPLFPLQGYAVVADPGFVEEIALWIGIGQPIAVVPLPLSWRSIFFGYLRSILAFGFPIALLVGLVVYLHFDTVIGALLLTFGVACPFLLRLSYRITRASPEQAETLRRLFQPSEGAPVP